jgi:hypothetical protein
LHELVQELRRGPVEILSTPFLVVGAVILEVVGKTRDDRELVTLLWVEMGMAVAGVDRQ